jgi:S1-C subfamily serine protease
MIEEEAPVGAPAGPGGYTADPWGTPGWPSPPPPPSGWWPAQYYTYDPPPPPRRTSRLRMVIVAVVLVVFGASAAATAVIATRGFGGTGSNAGVEAAIVDVNTTLDGGASAAGTGMVLSSSGEVLTNNHVIYNALSINVRVTSTGTTYPAHVIGFDKVDDVAVLQLDGASGLSTIPIGDSSSVQVGDRITALGNALGRGGPPASASGTVTALNQSITASDESGAGPQETLSGMIQIDAAIQPGDSGGPLVNRSAQVIGMDTAASGGLRWQQTGAVEAFAIPMNTAMNIAQQILKTPSNFQTATPGGFLGVHVEDSTAPPGARVITTEPGSPAAGTALVSGDVITGVGGAVVDSVQALHSLLAQHRPGDHVIVVWFTPSGQQRQATVSLATPPPGPPQ